jgi:hypothetical protein
MITEELYLLGYNVDALHVACFVLVYSLTLNIESVCSCKTMAGFN